MLINLIGERPYVVLAHYYIDNIATLINARPAETQSFGLCIINFDYNDLVDVCLLHQSGSCQFDDINSRFCCIYLLEYPPDL